MFALAAMGGGGGGSRVRGVQAGESGENIAHLKAFMATMDPVVVPPEFPEPKARRPEPKVEVEEVKVEVVSPWVKGAFKEPLISEEDNDAKERLRVFKELEHPLAHIGDPKRRISLKHLTPEETALVDNAIEAANTARLLAAERNRLQKIRLKEQMHTQRDQHLKLKNLSEYVREEAAAKRKVREQDQDEAAELVKRKASGGHLTDVEISRLRVLSVRLAGGHMSARSGCASFRSSLPSARSCTSTQTASAAMSDNASLRGMGAVILSPRGTSRRVWTPRSRSPRSDFDDASLRSTPWSTPFSSPRFKSSFSPRGPPRTGWETPRQGGKGALRPTGLQVDTAEGRFHHSTTPSQTPRTARSWAGNLATPRSTTGNLNSARSAVRV